MKRRSFIASASAAVAGLMIAKPATANPPKLKLVTVYRLEGGSWTRIDFSELRANDQFRVGDDEEVYCALTDAEPCEPDGNWTVKVG